MGHEKKIPAHQKCSTPPPPPRPRGSNGWPLIYIFQSVTWCHASLLLHFHWLTVWSRLTYCLQRANVTKTLYIRTCLYGWARWIFACFYGRILSRHTGIYYVSNQWQNVRTTSKIRNQWQSIFSYLFNFLTSTALGSTVIYIWPFQMVPSTFWYKQSVCVHFKTR